jgi:hypothetical protein
MPPENFPAHLKDRPVSRQDNPALLSGIPPRLGGKSDIFR